MHSIDGTPMEDPTTAPLANGEKLWPKTIQFGAHTLNTDEVAGAFEIVGKLAYDTAQKSGFYDADVDTSLSTKMMMVVGEISELFEAYRDGNPPSEKIPGYSCIEEEAADAIIRLLGDFEARDLNLAGATVSKLIYNLSRPYKHGKRF